MCFSIKLRMDIIIPKICKQWSSITEISLYLDTHDMIQFVLLVLKDVFSVSTRDQTIELGLYLSLNWRDPRILFDNDTNETDGSKVPVDPGLVEGLIWKPG